MSDNALLSVTRMGCFLVMGAVRSAPGLIVGKGDWIVYLESSLKWAFSLAAWEWPRAII